MRSKMKLLTVLGVLAFALLVAMPASANCIPGKVFASIDPANALYVYVQMNGGDNDSVTARFWQDGNRSAGNEGSYDDARWLLPFGGPGRYYISGDLGDADAAGCITGRMNLLLQNNNGGVVDFMFATAAEGTGAAAYDFARIGSPELSSAPLPRPRVLSSSRAGSTVNLNVVVDAATGGTHGDNAAADVSYRVMQTTGTADPGRGAAAYTVLGTVTPGSPAPFTVDCTNTATDRWIATQLVIDGGQQVGDLVSAPVRINCNPALADPDKGFKVIDRKGAKSPTRQ